MRTLYARIAIVAALIVVLLVLPVPSWTQPHTVRYVAQPSQPQQQAPPSPQRPPAATEPRRVTAVEIRGHRRVPTEHIMFAVTHIKVGEPVNDEQIRADIGAILDLGVFADVSARLEATQEGVRVVFLVVENPVVSEVIVEGNAVVSGDDIRKALGVRGGEVLNLKAMREGARAVQKLYEGKGYVLARVADIGIIPADGGRLRIRMAEGTVEAIRIQGLRRTREQILRRHLTVKPADVFNVNLLNRDLQRIFDLGLFESVRAQPQPGSAPDSAVVVIEVREARTAQITGGIGYSSRDGLLGFVEFRDRNWRGLGQTFAVRAERGVQTGSQRFNYDLSFTEPFLDEYKTSLDLSLFSRSLIEREFTGGAVSSRFELLRTGSFLALTRPLDPITMATVRLKSELAEITPLPIDPNNPSSAVVNPSNLAAGRVVSLQLSAVRDTRNDRFLPTSGERTVLATEFGLQALGGDFSFGKYSAEYQHFFHAGRDSTIVGRALVGLATGTLPVQEKFILGGASTVRAFQTGRFRDDSIFVANVEFRFPLGALIRQLSDVQGVVFVDGGNAPLQFNDLKVGYGVGLVVKTPVGPLRIDLAFGPEGQQTWLSLGAPF